MVRTITGWLLGAAGLLAGCHASVESPPPADTLPAPRAGGDVLGARIPVERLEDGSPWDEPAPATLLRWWTDTCPWCEASLPALEELRARFEPRGLRTVAVYHPKPPRAVAADAVRDLAAERGYRGPLARDLHWDVLREFWLDTGPRPATSASFLLDGTGRIRFVHPGPVFFPSDDPEHGREDADFADLVRAVEALLEEAGR